MNPFALFTEHVRDAVTALAAESGVSAPDLSRIVVEPPREESHGDLAINAAMVLAKDFRAKPRDLAEKIATKIRTLPDVTKVEIAGPGFINVTLLPAAWLRVLSVIIAAGKKFGAETKMIRLNDLKFRHCEGYFSKSLHACTWPCSITQMDPSDQLDQVYEALVHWADAIIVATPIRWGAPSSLYFKMVERLNCVQVDVATQEQQIIMNKVAGFIIVGGQDNIQGVAGQMLSFFGELGFLFPKFPYIAHSRGWSHEDMENNVRMVRDSKALAEGAKALAARCLEMAGRLVETEQMAAPAVHARGGLKGRPVAPDGTDRA